MSDTIQSAEAFLDSVNFVDTETYHSAIKFVESRDAEIRADEARKQAERYAACIADIKERIKLDKDTFSACGRSTVGHFRALMLIDESLADLEATK
jgi:hypothetical protein